MKTLLLVLFLPIMGMGQSYITSLDSSQMILSKSTFFNGSEWIASDTTATMIEFHQGITKYYVNGGLAIGKSFTPKEVDFDTYVMHVVSKKWEDYKRACYADSTIKWGLQFCDGPGCWFHPMKEGEEYLHTKAMKFVTHKSPNDLAEFMEYIGKLK